jgi:hypothetical protein
MCTELIGDVVLSHFSVRLRRTMRIASRPTRAARAVRLHSTTWALSRSILGYYVGGHKAGWDDKASSGLGVVGRGAFRVS